jgi:hypothetical protein
MVQRSDYKYAHGHGPSGLQEGRGDVGYESREALAGLMGNASDAKI